MAALASPHRAAAHDWKAAGEAGLYFGWRFGSTERARFALGLEARGVGIDRTETCGGSQQLYCGAVARLELVGRSQQTLTMGPVFGSTNGAYGYAFEATGGFAFGGSGGPVAQVGAEGMALLLLNARVAYTIGRDWLLGGGVRFPPLSMSAFCITLKT